MARNTKQQRRSQKQKRKRSRSRTALGRFGGRSRNDLAKMSDTLVAFAEPLLDALPPNAGVEDWDRALLTASFVWNGVVTGKECEVVADLERMSGNDPSVPDVVNMLFERKRRLFSHDSRLIANVQAQDTPHGIRVVAASVVSW